MRIGIFGGTFNPIHNSHLYVAQECLKKLNLNRMVIMPALIPPHKPDKKLAKPEDRLEMCKLATEGLDLFHVSDYEIRSGGESLTYKTLRYLAEKYPGSELFLIMGGDTFLAVQDWKRPEEVYKLATICVVQREKNELTALDMQKDRLEMHGARCVIVDIDAHPLSSTLVRSMIRTGDNPGDFLPPAVYGYIKKNKLYRK